MFSRRSQPQLKRFRFHALVTPSAGRKKGPSDPHSPIIRARLFVPILFFFVSAIGVALKAEAPFTQFKAGIESTGEDGAVSAATDMIRPGFSSNGRARCEAVSATRAGNPRATRKSLSDCLPPRSRAR